MRNLLLAISLLFWLPSMAANRKGDVNNDGDVSLQDVMMMVDKILGVTDSSFVFANADMNNDNEISLVDILMVVDLILSGEDMGPGSAEDPDVDGK